MWSWMCILCPVFTCWMLFAPVVRGGMLQDGGRIDFDTTWRRVDSPVTVRGTVFVGLRTTLTIEPGVTVRFAPRTMLAVNGTLIARGTQSQRIRFTKDSGTDGQWPMWPRDVRLVDDQSVAYGRLQLLYQGSWRGICANFQNWTETDVNVTCRQLGFEWGNFSFVPWARNDSLYMLYHKPGCAGTEGHLQQCPNHNNIKIGSRICQNQQTIRLHCYGLAPHSPATNYWWGMEFYNASTTPAGQSPIWINESSSVLQHVDVEYAGVDEFGSAVPAIRAGPTAPFLLDAVVRHCALDATNFTDIKASTVVRRSLLHNNRGHGLVVETHMGRVNVTDSEFRENMGHGIKAKFLDGRHPVHNEINTFCQLVNIQGERFPQMIIGIPADTTSVCEKRFDTERGLRVTLNFLEMDIEENPDVKGKFEIFDGERHNWQPLASFDIINGTLPQGVTSSFQSMLVRFSYTLPPSWERPSKCQYQRHCIKFTMVVDTARESMPEFSMNNTLVTNNTQHGVFIENVRNFIHVNASTITHNMYGAGLRVYGGAGDIQINASSLDHNHDNGVNISYDGGWRIFNMSSFSNNLGNGINITLNETQIDNRTRYANSQRTEVFRSEFVLNDGHGFRVANSCRPGIAVVNDSLFELNHGVAVEMESCFKIIPDNNVTNFTIAYNQFIANYGHAIRITPIINVVGRISNNTFKNHPRHTLLLDNTDDFLNSAVYSELKVQYEVMENTFENNRGFYVANLRLTHESPRQRMYVKFNRFWDNVIEGAFPTLNERTKAYGVVIVSSDNVIFNRNNLRNPNSRYEITTHLLDSSVPMSATEQYWGTTDYELIVHKIFDQYSRFDLPLITYHPVLLYDDLYNSPTSAVGSIELKLKFSRGDLLGGRLINTFTTLPGKTYFVDRDINIVGDNAPGKLVLSPGTTLEFQNALGLLVQGELQVKGTEQQPVVLKLLNQTTVYNSSKVRLVQGSSELEGRVEVLPQGELEWGTVCKQGWKIADASVVCQMLGMVVHPGDWQVYGGQPGSPQQPIWRSNVQCTELDMDITQCRADGPLDHSCEHTDDVWVKCKLPTWAGMRFLTKANPSAMNYVTITRAGLMDPTAIIYAPALRIDYNTHTLEHLIVTDNVDDGIEIMHNDATSRTKLAHSTVSYNQGNGVSVRGSFFELYNCTLHANTRAGFEYNPHYTTYEAQRIRNGIHQPNVFDGSLTYLHLDNENREFVITRRKSTDDGNENMEYQLEVTVNGNHHLVMDILDYNPDTSQELITVYNSRALDIQPHSQRWVVEDDLPDFPIVALGGVLTVRWKVQGIASGRFAFVLRSNPDNRPWPWPEIRVRNTTTSNNEHGIVTRHYNQPSNEYHDLFFRYRWELLQMYGVTFDSNLFEALHVPSLTKYHELYLPTFEELQIPYKISEIAYEVDSCLFTRNGGGILGEHNHIEFSNNAWIWQVTNNRFDSNLEGGFNIELPKINMMYTDLYNHSVDINDTIFENNDRFEFLLQGFYFNSTIARNRFQGNKCKVGCFAITGTEKDFDMHDNEFVENEGKYIVELHMTSHTPYTTWVEARVENNNFKRNTKPLETQPSPVSSPTSYTFGVKGLQNITINRNLFSNKLDFELLGGYASSSLENYLDVTENYWGTVDQEEIRAKIFDFDDWNNYAIAEYYPFLIGDHYQAALSTSVDKWYPAFDPNKPMGGRIESHLRLAKRSEPYIVRSDLTIMPSASLFIEKGVELQFYPNVGILVLGSLTARGNEQERISFKPIAKSSYTTNSGQGRKKRGANIPFHDHSRTSPMNEGSTQIRLSGGQNADEGFIEIFNSTERRWTIVCDSNFNERTAETACNTMGKESTNAIVRRSMFYDHFVLGYPRMHEAVIEWFWRRTFICDGTEKSVADCRYKINYNLYDCMDAHEYVFVRCGPRNLAPEYDYWGNIRFSTPEFEAHDQTPGYSHLEYVDIYGAGILHGEKAAALQPIHRSPGTEYIRITHCASNGYDYIAPKGEFEVIHNVIQNNNGYAFGCLVLNGESNYEERRSSFVPLVESTIPYDVFGLVRMCTSEKLLHVRSRILIYYKYEFETVDCIKIIRSKEPRRAIAIRFLQLNVYNDTFYENAVEMYSGEYFEPDMLIGKMTANSTLEQRRYKYQTHEPVDTMGIRVTASPAYGDHGFIAEVVTLPFSSGGRPDFGAGQKQRFANSIVSDNEGGGFKFRNVGEINPAVIVELNQIQRNGLKLLNMTSPAMISSFVQNSRMQTIANNYMVGNAGGIEINSTTLSRSQSIYCNITNNVINYNTHGEPLHIEGHHFQGFDVRNNYMAYNRAGDRNVVAMFDIAANFSNNVVFNNTCGFSILNASVPKQIDINQRFVGNAFYDNQAYGSNRSTVFLRSAKHQFLDNYFVNMWNFFEMVTYNRTKYDDGVYPEVQAPSNWWGSGTQAYVAGRIWDRRDDDELIGIIFSNFYTTNTTIVQGKCYPGWRLYNHKCYWYFGGVVPYHQAVKECKANRARLAFARDREWERYLGEIVSSTQENYNEFWQVWVYSEYQRSGYCTVLQNYKIEHVDCDTILPFVCERDPYVTPTTDWYPLTIALAVSGSILLLVAILVAFACLKSRMRNKQRIQRRTDLHKSLAGSRQSVFANRPAAPPPRLPDDNISYSKHRRPPIGANMDENFMNLTGVTMDDTSTESVEKAKLDFHRPSTPASFLEHNSSTKLDASSYFDSDIGPSGGAYGGYEYRPPRLENEIGHIMTQPTYDQTFRNDAYDDDRSLDLSRNTAYSTGAQGYSVTPYSRDTLASTSSSAVQQKKPRPRPRESAM